MRKQDITYKAMLPMRGTGLGGKIGSLAVCLSGVSTYTETNTDTNLEPTEE